MRGRWWGAGTGDQQHVPTTNIVLYVVGLALHLNRNNSPECDNESGHGLNERRNIMFPDFVFFLIKLDKLDVIARRLIPSSLEAF